MNSPIICLHIADLHFGVENYGFTNPKTGLNTRLEDFSRSLSQAVDYAVQTPVDVVLLAGDAYKRNSPSPTEQRELVKHLCRLADAGIPTVMIAGNHDIPVMAGKASAVDIFLRLRPDLFHVYINRPTAGDPPPLILTTQKGPLAVCCLPYLSPSWLKTIPEHRELNGKELQEAYESFYQEIIEQMNHLVPEPIPRILLAHCTVHGALYGGYRPTLLGADEIQILPANLAYAGYDYVALGHIHRHQNLSPKKEVPIVYSGSIDRVDFGEADEKKGFVVAQVIRGYSEFQFMEIPVREFIHVKVATQRGDDITEKILSALRREGSRLADAVVRITYDADEDEVFAMDMKSIQAALRSVHFKAGFFRNPRDDSQKRRSTTLSQEVTLADALAAYIREHAEYQEHSAALFRKTKEIEDAVRPEF